MSTKHNIENNEQLKKNAFQVPQGYFEQLEDKLNAIPQEQEAKVIPLKSQRLRRRLLAVAAVFIVVITATWQFLPKHEEELLTADDIIALTYNGYLPYSEMAFLEVVDDEALDTISFEASSLGDYYEETQPELIEEYYY
jgi:hypothetical protein